MIAILDYGAGNLCSVANTLNALQAPYNLITTVEEVNRATKIILPGVGHFGQMMRALDKMKVREPLVDRLESGVPFLGICLGMQALFEGSDEAAGTSGLGIFQGRARRFPTALRVPHMGWNQVKVNEKSRLFDGFTSTSEPWFYFAHSYYVPESDMTAASCEYSVRYTAAVERRNIFGVQFHPEKSADAGQSLVSAFLAI